MNRVEFMESLPGKTELEKSLKELEDNRLWQLVQQHLQLQWWELAEQLGDDARTGKASPAECAAKASTMGTLKTALAAPLEIIQMSQYGESTDGTD